MMKIIITGATGFIGKALCKRLLDEGNYIYAVVRDKDKIKEFEVYKNFATVELHDKHYIQLSNFIQDEIDIVYHLGWQDSAGAGRNNYGIQIPQIQYTCDLIMEVHKLKCKKIIFAGSISYFMEKHYLNKKDMRCSQTCLYGTAKNAANLFARTLCHNLNIKYNDVLFTNIFGIGDYSLRSTNIIINKLIHNQVPTLVEGQYKYDWFYIDNAVEAIIAVEKEGKNFKSYYIGNKEVVSFKQLMMNIKEIVNPNIQLEFGTIDDTTHANYNKIDTKALYEDTNFSPLVSFEESILKTIEWVRSLNIGE